MIAVGKTTEHLQAQYLFIDQIVWQVTLSDEARFCFWEDNMNHTLKHNENSTIINAYSYRTILSSCYGDTRQRSRTHAWSTSILHSPEYIIVTIVIATCEAYGDCCETAGFSQSVVNIHACLYPLSAICPVSTLAEAWRGKPDNVLGCGASGRHVDIRLLGVCANVSGYRERSDGD